MDNKTTGFTLIEMLVGIVIGMIVVAAASVMMVSVLKSQKDVTASARLNQELGAAMAVMSNEIRRAGFSVCDVANSDCDGDGDGIEEFSIKYNTSVSDKDLEIVGGNCVLYRYNADMDIDDESSEQRGFRLVSYNGVGVIQMAASNGGVACNDAADSVKWIALTDLRVIDIDLSFSTANSRCRNLYKDWYWVVRNGEIGMPCAATSVDCLDPSGGGCNSETGDQLFGTRLVTINLQATLIKDSLVSKNLKSSIKVATPWVGKAL